MDASVAVAADAAVRKKRSAADGSTDVNWRITQQSRNSNPLFSAKVT